MKKPLSSLLCLLLIPVFALTACKPRVAPAADAPAAVTASPAPAASAVPAPAAAPVSQAAAAAPAAVTATGKPFDVNTVPVTTAAIPPFPYISLPKGTDGYGDNEVVFERVHVVAGNELRPVEGHLSVRSFPLSVIKMSSLAAFRNYDAALKAMGAVPVNAIVPADPKFVAQYGGDIQAIAKKLFLQEVEESMPNDVPPFVQYLLRTPTANVWISFAFYNAGRDVTLVVLEEKALQQSVGPLSAAAMARALKQDGHIALYLNFDSDSAVMRADSLPVVGQVAQLLDADQALTIAVEGHTDASGDAVHNRELSLRRARSVVAALTTRNIADSRLRAAGKGADQPIADNGSEQGRSKNRRVELVRT